ncbi:bacteriohemerythrin [Dendrosporobacter sp. 1207_IL3150]|uniref:bacteriohemerythrin n=1 Tax=Dendrosporobacter sp. 1207_IL3150 TaxID=3084054 RepID=UPI002FD8E46F
MLIKGWKSEYSVNIKQMDEDHQKLINVITALMESMRTGQTFEIASNLIKDLESYSLIHFMREESYLKAIEHPDLQEHKEQHKVFIKKIKEIKAASANGNKLIAIQMLPFINQWFINHVLKMDMKYKSEKV